MNEPPTRQPTENAKGSRRRNENDLCRKKIPPSLPAVFRHLENAKECSVEEEKNLHISTLRTRPCENFLSFGQANCFPQNELNVCNGKSKSWSENLFQFLQLCLNMSKDKTIHCSYYYVRNSAATTCKLHIKGRNDDVVVVDTSTLNMKWSCCYLAFIVYCNNNIRLSKLAVSPPRPTDRPMLV